MSGEEHLHRKSEGGEELLEYGASTYFYLPTYLPTFFLFYFYWGGGLLLLKVSG